MHEQSPEQLDHFLSRLPRVRPTLRFRAAMRFRLFTRALASDLEGHLLVRTVSFAGVSLGATVMLLLSWFAYDNPAVYAGTPLFGLKRTIERIEFSLTATSPEEEAQAYLKIAERRRDELSKLRSKVGQGFVNRSALKETLDEVVGNTNRALKAARQSANPTVTAQVTNVAAHQAEELKRIQETITSETTPISVPETDDAGIDIPRDEINEVPNGGTVEVSPDSIATEETGDDSEATSGSGSETPDNASETEPADSKLIEQAATALEHLASSGREATAPEPTNGSAPPANVE